jgi:hypothetical protein
MLNDKLPASIERPSEEELARWNIALQEENLGMYRGYNSEKLVYGAKFLQTPTAAVLQDALVWIRQKRKEENYSGKGTCVVCGETFLERADAKCCPHPKRCCLKTERKACWTWIMSAINKLRCSR